MGAELLHEEAQADRHYGANAPKNSRIVLKNENERELVLKAQSVPRRKHTLFRL